MEIFILLTIFVLGLCFGSFVNMLVYRTAVRYKLKKAAFAKATASQSRSFCDFCGKQLKWYENIPVISWIIQKRKTECCGKKLPVTYPLVELLMGVSFVINFQFLISNDQLNWYLILLNFVIVIFLVFSAVFDLKYMILPDFSTWILISSALVLWFVGHWGQLDYFYSAIIAGVFLLFLYLITKGKGMGMGDVKLALFMGLLLGYPKIVMAFYVAFITGALVGIILLVFFKFKKRSPIPFGPFLILGTMVAQFIRL